MRITYTPSDFSGVFSERMFKIGETNENNITNVEIVRSNGKLLGVKRYHGEKQYTVNVAPYVAPLFNLGPAPVSRPEFIDSSLRACEVYIRVSEKRKDGTNVGSALVSDNVNFMAGAENMSTGRMMSDAEGRIKIAVDEWDEISFSTRINAGVKARITLTAEEGDEVMYVDAGGLTGSPDSREYECTHGLSTFCLHMKDIMEIANETRPYDFKNIKIEILGASMGQIAENELIAMREYEIVPRRSEAVRVCWVNRYGVLDYYSFRKIGGKEIELKKKQVESGGRSVVVRSEYNEYYDVWSECEPEKTIEWIAGIILAPKVWIVREEYHDTVPVEVEQKSVKFEKGRPTALSLKIKGAGKKTFQYGI